MDATTSIDSAVTSNLTSAFSDVTPTEYEGQVTWSAELAIFMAVIACYGAAGNLFIIGAVLLRPNLRTRGNAFVINLAVADLIVTGYIMPLGIATSQYKLKPFSDALCDFNAFLVVTTCGISTQSLMLIAIERYFHVCRMRQYDRVFTPTLVAVYIVFAWLYTLVAVDYGDHQTPLSAIYYSVVTVTTLGYGDVLPASGPAQVVAMAQVIIGYVMLGGLLSIISNKMVRRAE